jgi:hypothetical protein
VTIEGLIMIKLHVTFLEPDSDAARPAWLARPAERDLRLGLEFDLLGNPVFWSQNRQELPLRPFGSLASLLTAPADAGPSKV